MAHNRRSELKQIRIDYEQNLRMKLLDQLLFYMDLDDISEKEVRLKGGTVPGVTKPIGVLMHLLDSIGYSVEISIRKTYS